jgi:hypothetical protein
MWSSHFANILTDKSHSFKGGGKIIIGNQAIIYPIRIKLATLCRIQYWPWRLLDQSAPLPSVPDPYTWSIVTASVCRRRGPKPRTLRSSALRLYPRMTTPSSVFVAIIGGCMATRSATWPHKPNFIFSQNLAEISISILLMPLVEKVPFMNIRESISIHPENNMKHIIFCGPTTNLLNGKAGGTYSNHCGK